MRFDSIARFIKLMAGLAIFGIGLGAMVKAHIGIGPWDVFAQGISKLTNLSFGTATVMTSILVLIAWLPLRQKYGLGTILNALLIGVFTDLWSPLVPTFDLYWLQVLQFTLGMVIMAFATGMYISAHFGAGPRDGLMIGTSKALRKPIWMVRTGYEVIVLCLGWLMGGQVREGTLIFALCIGVLMQASMRLFKYQK
ncbi:MAG: hypothetical protein RL670_640 [Actinomycetota bacterium]